MNDERRGSPLEVDRPAPGLGHIVRKHCMGCNEWRSSAASSGSGIRYRCGVCTLARAVAAGEVKPPKLQRRFCGMCAKPMLATGSSVRRVDGVNRRVGPCCERVLEST